MTDNRTPAKRPPVKAKGDCTICKAWIDDGRGGTCALADDYWTPHCPHYEKDKPVKNYPMFGFC